MGYLDDKKTASRDRKTRAGNNEATRNTSQTITQINVSTAATVCNDVRQSIPVESALAELLHRDDGYLKIVPDENDVFHYYWNFSRGPHAGKYCYWGISRQHTLASGLTGLLRKLSEIDAGKRKPAVSPS